jgi:hypothetical protein
MMTASNTTIEGRKGKKTWIEDDGDGSDGEWPTPDTGMSGQTTICRQAKLPKKVERP